MRFFSQANSLPRLSTLSLVIGLFAAATTTSLALPSKDDGWLNLTVIHTNDVHSRVDPANDFGVSCTAQDIEQGHCYGGSARHKTVIDRLRQGSQNSLLLDGGDEVSLPSLPFSPSQKQKNQA